MNLKILILFLPSNSSLKFNHRNRRSCPEKPSIDQRPSHFYVHKNYFSHNNLPEIIDNFYAEHFDKIYHDRTLGTEHGSKYFDEIYDRVFGEKDDNTYFFILLLNCIFL